MRLAVQVTGRVVGLTNSSVRGMSSPLGHVLPGRPAGPGPEPRWAAARAADDKRAARVLPPRREAGDPGAPRRPSADVISQLLQQDFSDLEILTEALTYAAAGMATTREFVTVAAWHLLDEPELRTRYLAAERAEREAILHEILRLEPVVGELRRGPGSRSPCRPSRDR